MTATDPFRTGPGGRPDDHAADLVRSGAPANDAIATFPWAVDPGTGKLAERLADQISREILTQRLKPGTNLGSETELRERYGVGRGILREAIRLLEHLSLVTMRRGRGGGLIVDDPSQSGIQRAVATYLQFNGVQLRHLFDAREMLELAVVERLVERATDAELAELEGVVEGQAAVGLRITESTSFHLLLAEMTENPATLLFTETLIRLTFAHLDPASGGQAKPEASAEGHVAHRALVAAMRARDLPMARQQVVSHLERVAERF